MGITFMITGLVCAILYALPTHTNPDARVWLTPEYYSQFLPVALFAMLLISGVLMTFRHSKANFNLAVFGHTASEEAIFNGIGWTNSAFPTWTLILVFLLSLLALWVAYSNVLEQKRLSIGEALFGIVFGAALVLLPKVLA